MAARHNAHRGFDEEFRLDARSWISKNLPDSLIGVANPNAESDEAPAADFLLWKAAMVSKGWVVPTWPKEYGGGDLTQVEAVVLQEELKRAGAPHPAETMGVMMLGPALLEFGSQEQKLRHLPPIARDEVRWCQGYSEPGAGSDLAAVQTSAVDRGDHFLVNGRKIWTSGAQWADWCFALVRTDKSSKHRGISFLLIDMSSTGIDVQPIAMISGSSLFCEVQFTDLVVQKENLVGALNDGWTIGKRVLQYERTAASSDHLSSVMPSWSLSDLSSKHQQFDPSGGSLDSDLRSRLIDFEMRTEAFSSATRRASLEVQSGGPSASASVLKNVGAKLAQEKSELAIEVMGLQGLGWEGEGFDAEELEITRQWLFLKAFTIFGGTTEIQNNVIAKSILGMKNHE